MALFRVVILTTSVVSCSVQVRHGPALGGAGDGGELRGVQPGQQPRGVDLRRRQGHPQHVGHLVVLLRGGQSLQTGHEVQRHGPPGRQALLFVAAGACSRRRFRRSGDRRRGGCGRAAVLGIASMDPAAAVRALW